MKKKSEWTVSESISRKDDRFWSSSRITKLRNIIYNKFEELPIEEWESYKLQNEIKQANPQKVKVNWKNAFYYEGINEQNGIEGDIVLELEYHDEKNKVLVIKDPFTGVGWDYGEPSEGSDWIGIPESIAEKLIMINSFKN